MAESLATNGDSRSCTGATSLHGGSACEVYGLRHRGHDVGRSGGLLSSKAKTQNLAHLMEVDQSERWGLAALRGKGFCSVHFEFHIFGNLDQSQCRPGYSPFQYPLACAQCTHACTLYIACVAASAFVTGPLTVHALCSQEDTEIETVARSSIFKVVLIRQHYFMQRPHMVYSCLSKAHRHVASSVWS